MVDVKEANLDNSDQEKPKLKDTHPVESRFREKRQAMRDRAAGIQKGLQEIVASTPPGIDLSDERDELAGLELRLTRVSDKAQSELDESEKPKSEQRKEELTGEVSMYVQELVDSSGEIGKTRPGESRPVTRKTEYLRRPGEKDANAIQVQIALGEKGGNVIRIENYALGTDARGHIAELKTLIIGEDGIARVLHADRYGTHGGRKGIWSSKTSPADATDIQEAYDAVRRLREEEASTEEGGDQGKEGTERVRSEEIQTRKGADQASEGENAGIREEIFGADRLTDSRENPANDEDRAKLLAAIIDMADNREGSNTSRNVRPSVGETVRYLDRHDAKGHLLPWQDGLIVVSHPVHIQGHSPTYEAMIKNVVTNATRENASTDKENIAVTRDGEIFVIRERIIHRDKNEPERWVSSIPASRADVQKALEVMSTLYRDEQERKNAKDQEPAQQSLLTAAVGREVPAGRTRRENTGLRNVVVEPTLSVAPIKEEALSRESSSETEAGPSVDTPVEEALSRESSSETEAGPSVDAPVEEALPRESSNETDAGPDADTPIIEEKRIYTGRPDDLDILLLDIAEPHLLNPTQKARFYFPIKKTIHIDGLDLEDPEGRRQAVVITAGLLDGLWSTGQESPEVPENVGNAIQNEQVRSFIVALTSYLQEVNVGEENSFQISQKCIDGLTILVRDESEGGKLILKNIFNGLFDISSSDERNKAFAQFIQYTRGRYN